MLTNAGVLLADESPMRHSRLFCTRWYGLDKASGIMEALDEMPCKCDVLIHRELILQGNIKTVCELSVLTTLHFFNGVPEDFPVCVLRGSVDGQQDFRTDDSALAGVVAALTVVFAVELFPGTVGGSSHGGLSGAALDLGDMKMKQCDGQALPWSWAWIAFASKI